MATSFLVFSGILSIFLLSFSLLGSSVFAGEVKSKSSSFSQNSKLIQGQLQGPSLKLQISLFIKEICFPTCLQTYFKNHLCQYIN